MNIIKKIILGIFSIYLLISLWCPVLIWASKLKGRNSYAYEWYENLAINGVTILIALCSLFCTIYVFTSKNNKFEEYFKDEY